MAKVTDSDIEKMNKRNNPPKNEPGFEETGIEDILKECDSDASSSDMNIDFDSLDSISDSDFDDIFSDDDIESVGPSKGKKGKISFDEVNKQLDSDASSGNFSGFDGSTGANTRTKSDEISDLVLDACSSGISYIWKSVKMTFMNVKKKDGNDIGKLAKNTFMTAGLLVGVSGVSGLIRLFTGLRFIGRFGIRMLVPSVMFAGIGIIEIAISGYYLSSGINASTEDSEKASEIDKTVGDIMNDSYEDDGLFDEDSVDDILNDDDNDDLWGGLDDNADEEESDNSLGKSIGATQGGQAMKKEDSGDSIESILSMLEQSGKNKNINEETYQQKFEKFNGIHAKIDRAYLYDTFKSFFKFNCMDFGKEEEVDRNSDIYNQISINVIKAMGAASGQEFEGVKTEVESIKENSSSYIISVKRMLGLNNIDAIKREVENYLKDEDSDKPAIASVQLDGDNYKIIVQKNKMQLVTLGDTLKISEVEKFIKDEKNALPYVIGTSETGKVIYRDAKHYSSMLIAGLPRSGKTWGVVNLMVQLMAFNTPDDVQFVLIDPKKTSLFDTLSLMPHVAGLHSGNVNLVLGGIVKQECERRAKLLQDAKCDDIWELRNRKGLKLPILYVVIDEFISICDAFKDSGDKEGKDQFDSYISTIVTQMPSKGVRLIIIAHRAQNYVDKTVRSNMSFICAVNALDDVVKDTLGVKKFPRALYNIGDSAIRAVGDSSPFYAKGIGVTSSDTENRELITYMAKSYYKMGVKCATTKYLGYAANRDENKIKRELDDYDKPMELDSDSDNIVENDRDKTIKELLKQTQEDF